MNILIIILSAIHVSYQVCSWDACNQWSTEKNVLNVHLIPHTHDDLGWIKTVDQYYYGGKASLVPVGVQYIYNTVIEELQKDSTRKFSFAETGFLWRWFTSNSDFDRHKLQKLVKDGQIELIGGGWVQNDEAASHYVDIIDQMTFGLKKLKQLFGECGKPKVAWQIDPFGHSREQANIFAMMGYSSLFFARIHYLEKEVRLQNRSLEFIWNASDDLKTQILTGAFFQDNYGPPDGFCWDRLCGDDPIMDNPDLDEYNVDEKIAAFVKYVKNQASNLRSNHVMLLMGSDFQYTNANQWYTNMDKLIRYVNNNASHGVHVFYSTPSCYSKGLIEAQPHLTTKSDDFFPYASSNHSYWTGYFTSKPSFKRMIREASTMLQLAKQLDAQADLGPNDDSDVEKIAKTSALVQHHDAVTGTAKENVTRDYEKRLSTAMREGEIVIRDFLKKFSPRKTSVDLPQQLLCPLINETICTAVRDMPTFSVTVFNSKAQNMNAIIRVPFYSKQAMVFNDKGKMVNVQLSKTFQVPALSSADRAPFELLIPVDVLPLGYSTYIVDNSTSMRSTNVIHPSRFKIGSSTEKPISIQNEYLELSFDSHGFLSTITEKDSNTTHNFRQEFFYYQGMGNSTQPSGAYIFRPAVQEPIAIGENIKMDVIKGRLVEEVRQNLSPWVSQIIRLNANSNFIEFDWVVGPIPKEKNGEPISKEVVTRYFTDIHSKGIFFTDANGRQMMRREVNKCPSFKYENTEPIAGNYYPITNRIYIKDDSRQLTVLPDRAEGATSTDGMIEIMIHRRCFFDDHWGVDEALNETGRNGKGLTVRGTHTVIIGKSKDAARIHRPLAVKIFNKPVVAFASLMNVTKFREEHNLQFSGLSRQLPYFVNLLTLEKWDKNQLLLRVEHLFQSEEDSENSRPVLLDFKDLFTQFTITSMKELMLAGNKNVTSSSARTSRNLRDLIVELKPMEIRTFEVEIKRKDRKY